MNKEDLIKAIDEAVDVLHRELDYIYNSDENYGYDIITQKKGAIDALLTLKVALKT